MQNAAPGCRLWVLHDLGGLSGKRSSSIRPSDLVMPSRSVGVRHMGRLKRRQRRRVTQIRGEHEDKRRDDAECKKRVQRRQDRAQVSPGTTRETPRNRRSSKSAQG